MIQYDAMKRIIYNMSQQEIKRLEVVQKLVELDTRQAKAAEVLGISVRQIQRLIKAYQKEGVDGLISKKRGKRSNHRVSESICEMAVFCIRNNYHDFGPTLASEKLLERHNIKLSVETVRKLMIEAGIWLPKAKHQGLDVPYWT